MVIVVVKNIGSSNESLGKKYNIIDAFALRGGEKIRSDQTEGESQKAVRVALQAALENGEVHLLRGIG